MKIGYACDNESTNWRFDKDLEECQKHCHDHGLSILAYKEGNNGCVCCSESSLSFNMNKFRNSRGSNVYIVSGTVNILIYF